MRILITGKAPSFDHILEKILGYLDYACLKQTELVSPVWLEAISERKFWKDIFLHNVGYFNYCNFILNLIVPSFIHTGCLFTPVEENVCCSKSGKTQIASINL